MGLKKGYQSQCDEQAMYFQSSRKRVRHNEPLAFPMLPRSPNGMMLDWPNVSKDHPTRYCDVIALLCHAAKKEMPGDPYTDTRLLELL